MKKFPATKGLSFKQFSLWFWGVLLTWLAAIVVLYVLQYFLAAGLLLGLLLFIMLTFGW